MKIGIITHHWGRDNYGQYLQHYAMQEFLRSQGHEPFLINFVPETPVLPWHKLLLKAALHPLRALNVIWTRLFGQREFSQVSGDALRYQAFLQFRERFFSISSEAYSSVEQLQCNPPCADIYITGSDQVWNPFGFFSAIPAFFLDFGKPGVRRVAYAASWGRSEIPAKEQAIITPLLKNFDVVTVRESSGIDLCRLCGCNHASCAPDPTFLLSVDHYQEISRPPSCKEEKYLLLYRVHNTGGDDFDYKKLAAWAALRGLRIKYITGNGLNDEFEKEYPSIEEWLGLIANAEYFVTNSFHGTVFGLMFRKRLGIIRLKGASKGMNARVETLWAELNADPLYIDDNNFDVLEQAQEFDTGMLTEKARLIMLNAVNGQ